MRAQLLNLTGPLRGQTRTYTSPRLLIGKGASAEVRYDACPEVVDRHAEIEFVEEGCSFYLRPLDGQVFVNRHEIEEVVLRDGDLIEFGKGGPRAKFRAYAEPGSVCKPVRHMLRDARAVGGESGPVAFSKSMARDLLSHATLQLKIGVPLVLLLLAGAAFAAGRWSSDAGGDGTGMSPAEESAEVAKSHAAEIEMLRDELGKLRESQAVSMQEVGGLRSELDRRSQALDRLQRQGVAVTEVHDTFARGVCLIHGTYGFKMPGDSEEFVSEASGKRVAVEYTGTGFLVSNLGQVVTNRHVAVPWDYDEQAKSLTAAGFRPAMLSFTATFPGDPKPRTIDPASVRVRAGDKLDVATVIVPVAKEMPVLKLSTAAPADFRGGPVLVVGYPTGVNALLAKASQRVVEAVTDGTPSLGDLIERLATNQAIRPSITSGVLGEVREEKLVYDAETTSGGSGGPVFNADGQVIGVNFAILRGFGGSNLGVPIRYVDELLK